VYWFGAEAGFNAMVVDRLGQSLEDLFVQCHFQFTIKTVLLLARQLVSQFDLLGHDRLANVCYAQLRRLQYIHSRNFIHRDLKPSNIIMGVGGHTDVVHLVDFGLSKEFRDPNTHVHIPFKKGLGLTGTATFASINSHLGLELGRRDDLESLAYVLIYFLWGALPWQGLRVEGQDILKGKRGITTLDAFHALPLEFRMFFDHCRSLSFDGKPDYDQFYRLFDSLLVKQGFQSDMAFDWDTTGREIAGQDFGNRSDVSQHGCSPSRKLRTG
jgi:serine/threonine protein kinase